MNVGITMAWYPLFALAAVFLTGSPAEGGGGALPDADRTGPAITFRLSGLPSYADSVTVRVETLFGRKPIFSGSCSRTDGVGPDFVFRVPAAVDWNGRIEAVGDPELGVVPADQTKLILCVVIDSSGTGAYEVRTGNVMLSAEAKEYEIRPPWPLEELRPLVVFVDAPFEVLDRQPIELFKIPAGAECSPDRWVPMGLRARFGQSVLADTLIASASREIGLKIWGCSGSRLRLSGLRAVFVPRTDLRFDTLRVVNRLSKRPVAGASLQMDSTVVHATADGVVAIPCVVDCGGLGCYAAGSGILFARGHRSKSDVALGPGLVELEPDTVSRRVEVDLERVGIPLAGEPGSGSVRFLLSPADSLPPIDVSPGSVVRLPNGMHIVGAELRGDLLASYTLADVVGLEQAERSAAGPPTWFWDDRGEDPVRVVLRGRENEVIVRFRTEGPAEAGDSLGCHVSGYLTRVDGDLVEAQLDVEARAFGGTMRIANATTTMTGLEILCTGHPTFRDSRQRVPLTSSPAPESESQNELSFERRTGPTEPVRCGILLVSTWKLNPLWIAARADLVRALRRLDCAGTKVAFLIGQGSAVSRYEVPDSLDGVLDFEITQEPRELQVKQYIRAAEWSLTTLGGEGCGGRQRLILLFPADDRVLIGELAGIVPSSPRTDLRLIGLRGIEGDAQPGNEGLNSGTVRSTAVGTELVRVLMESCGCIAE